MPQFVMMCIDKKDSLPLRMATREAHLAYVGAKGDVVRLVGPLLDEKGDMAGSLLIIEADDLAAARAFSAEDPYSRAGLFDRVEIHGVRVAAARLP